MDSTYFDEVIFGKSIHEDTITPRRTTSIHVAVTVGAFLFEWIARQKVDSQFVNEMLEMA